MSPKPIHGCYVPLGKTQVEGVIREKNLFYVHRKLNYQASSVSDGT